MIEKILRIEEITGRDQAGYGIVTDQQTIKLLMDCQQNYAERFGYFMSEDDFSEFEGAEIINVTLTDTALNTKSLKDNEIDDDSGERQIMFVNIHTSKGMLQFVAYNEHNGYYGHEATVECKQLKHEVML